MIHPSYVDLMQVVNKGVEEGETPVINSRYSIVMATAKRARQIVDGDEPLIEARKVKSRSPSPLRNSTRGRSAFSRKMSLMRRLTRKKMLSLKRPMRKSI